MHSDKSKKDFLPYMWLDRITWNIALLEDKVSLKITKLRNNLDELEVYNTNIKNINISILHFTSEEEYKSFIQELYSVLNQIGIPGEIESILTSFPIP